jgi:hypothetical protein
MSRLFRWFAFAGLALLVGFVGIVTSMKMQVPPEAIAMRQRLPYLSLANRLAYESQSPASDGESGPVLADGGTERLNAIEMVFDSHDSRARALSLQKLHSSEVAYFISRPGFGLSRMGRSPGRERLEYGDPPPIPLMADEDSATGQSSEMANLTVPDVPADRQVAAVPTQKELELFHRADQIAFTDPWSFGDVKDRNQVAGFMPHAFMYQPVVGDPANSYPRAYDPTEERGVPHSSRWKIARLELVSLLKFDQPAVYVSDHLPRMQDLADAQTRPLNTFEQQGLASLRAGDDLITQVDTNEIRMLGSLRSVKQCLECHSGRRGALLGAFSYQLRHHPPLPQNLPEKGPAT